MNRFWMNITQGWDWGDIWSGAGVFVNLFLGFVAYKAFKASRDSAEYAKSQAEAAKKQTEIANEEAEKIRREYTAHQSPKIFSYVKENQDDDGKYYYSINIINTNIYNMIFHGIQGRLKNFNDTYTRLDKHELRTIYYTQNDTPLVLAGSDYWLANVPEAPLRLRGRSDYVIEYEIYFTYLDSFRETYLWRFTIINGIGSSMSPFVSGEDLQKLSPQP